MLADVNSIASSRTLEQVRNIARGTANGQRGVLLPNGLDETKFVLAAFVFEDVCVTAHKGGSPSSGNNEFLEATAGILAVAASHPGLIRTVLASRGLYWQDQQISDFRDDFDGPSEIDFGIGTAVASGLVTAGANDIAFSRTPSQFLAVVYGSGTAQPGGFVPNGADGTVR